MKPTPKYVSFVSLLAGMISLASLGEVDAVKKPIRDAAVPSSSDSEKKDYSEDRKIQEKGGSLRARAELRYEISAPQDGKTEIKDQINGTMAVLDPRSGILKGSNLFIVSECSRRLSPEDAQSIIATVEMDQPQGKSLAAQGFSHEPTPEGRWLFSETGLRGRYLLTAASGLDGAQAGGISASISGLSGDSIRKMERSVKESNFKEGLEHVRMFHAAFGPITTGSFNKFGRSSTRAMQAQSALFAEKAKIDQEINDGDPSLDVKLRSEKYPIDLKNPKINFREVVPNIGIDSEKNRIYFKNLKDLNRFFDEYQVEDSAAILVRGKFDQEGFQRRFNVPFVETPDGAVMLPGTTKEREALVTYFRGQGVYVDYVIAFTNPVDFLKMRERLGAKNPSIDSSVP